METGIPGKGTASSHREGIHREFTRSSAPPTNVSEEQPGTIQNRGPYEDAKPSDGVNRARCSSLTGLLPRARSGMEPRYWLSTADITAALEEVQTPRLRGSEFRFPTRGSTPPGSFDFYSFTTSASLNSRSDFSSGEVTV